MNKRLKIALVWWFDKSGEIFDNYRDGVRAAMEVVGKKHKVSWYLDKTMPEPGKADFLLFWSSTNETYFGKLEKYKKEKKGLLLTTDPHVPENLHRLDVVYCESDPICKAVRAHGVRAVKAFGTDTNFFKPDHKTKKDIDYFYPATFSPWKRQDEIADYGDRLVCVGTIQPDGQDIYNRCVNRGVRCKVGYFPVEEIREFYRRAKNVPIPAIHGSERTVLEAMSMNILPQVIHPTNRRTFSYLVEYQQEKRLKPKLTPREFVLKNYSHKIYAKQIMKGINEVMKNDS